MKHTRYPGATYLEIDDLVGGRKVVLVAKDGVTYWDAMDAAAVTPIVIHPLLHPTHLGTMVAFAFERGLHSAMGRVIEFLRQRFDPKLETDPLFVMRVLWSVAQRGQGEPGYVPDDAALEWACGQAHSQAQTAVKLQAYAERFCALVEG